MTNTELLQAMSDLLDEKLEAKLEAKLQPMRDDMQAMKADIQDLQRKVAEIGMNIENCTDNNVQLLAESFIELTNKLNMAVPAAHNNYMYEIKVNYLWQEVDKIKQTIREKLV